MNKPHLLLKYQVTLESAGKRYFDAFRRHTKFDYALKVDGVEMKISTNCAQLRFIRFVIDNEIDKWLAVESNKAKAEALMKVQQTKTKKNKRRKVSTQTLNLSN